MTTARAWYDAQNYATFDQWLSTPYVCIAPTTRRDENQVSIRCSGQITADDLRSADEARILAESLSDAEGREEAVRDFVLFHCCSRWTHRKKLRSNKDRVLDNLVAAYAAKLARVEEQAATTASSATAPSAIQHGDLVIRVRPPPAQVLPPAYLTPYEPGEVISIQNLIMSSVPARYRDYGTVYSFIWRSHPEYVKIGFTSRRHISTRLEEQAGCYPGDLQVEVVYKFDFPERIEELIHSQLANCRYEILACDHCNCGHTEFFKCTGSEASQVILDWYKLSTREPLYTGDGDLSSKWKGRLLRYKGVITAKALLDLLDVEDRALRGAKSTTIKPNTFTAPGITSASNAIPIPDSTTVSMQLPQVNALLAEPDATTSSSPSPSATVISVEGAQSANQHNMTDIVELAGSDMLSYFTEFMSLIAQQEARSGARLEPSRDISPLSSLHLSLSLSPYTSVPKLGVAVVSSAISARA